METNHQIEEMLGAPTKKRDATTQEEVRGEWADRVLLHFVGSDSSS